ncbi:MAG TPA: hypothetical protein PKI32_02310 [Opitutales bacterium]|nr:hypothetical protein [Opitutales bacterium]
MKATTITNAGACGFTTTAVAECQPGSPTCHLSVETNCPHFAGVAAKLNGADLAVADEFDWGKSRVHAAMRENCTHTACPVPGAIIKAIQVASGKKPPVDAKITVRAE